MRRFSFRNELNALVNGIFNRPDPVSDHEYHDLERQQLHTMTTEQPRSALPYTRLVQNVNVAMDEHHIPISRYAVNAIINSIDVRSDETVDPLQRDINIVGAEYRVAQEFARDGSSLGETAHRALGFLQHSALSIGNDFNGVDDQIAANLAFRRLPSP
jgi:hypothetical protein